MSTSPALHPVLAATADMAATIKSVAGVNPTFMTTADKASAMVGIAALEAQLVELRLRMMTDAQDVATEHACGDAAQWFAHATRTSLATAKSDLALAGDLDRRWTALATGMRDGVVSADQTRVVARCLDALAPRVGPDVLQKAEAHLVGLAADHGPRALAKLGRKILDVVAPEIAEEGEARRLADLESDAAEGTVLRIRRKANGRIAISGELDDVTGTRFAIYLEA